MNFIWQFCNRKNTGFLLLCLAIIYIHLFAINNNIEEDKLIVNKEEEKNNDEDNCRGLCRQIEDFYVHLTEINVNVTS